jgi:serine protease Do
VGVNAFILTQTGGSVGLGFAIPIERAMRVARELREHGRVRRGWVGVEIAEPQAQSSEWRRQPGVLVRRVAPGGPGAAAGLKQGDVIEQVNGQLLRNFLGWEKALVDLAPGDRLRLVLQRTGGNGDVSLTATDLPSASAERVNLRDLELITVTPNIQAERGLATLRGALVVAAGPGWQRTLGLQSGDVIVQINNYAVARAEQVQQIIQYLGGRAAMRFYFARGDQLIYADMWGTP